MKNKVIALSLLITALSVVPTFGATVDNCNSIDLNKILSNSKIMQKGVSASQICDLIPSNILKSAGLSEKSLSDLISSKTNINISDLLNKKLNTVTTTQKQGTQKTEVKVPVTKPEDKTTENKVTETKKPETKAPETKAPETKVPTANKPETKAPETKVPATNNNENKTPVVKVPTTNNNQTQAPSTTNPTNNNSSNASVSSYEKQVVDLVNAERAKAGVAPLTLDSSISNVARTKSQDMATNNYFAHQSPTYGSAGNMLTKFGIKYTAWGENIASGQKTPQQVVTAWMNSEGHRANILSSTYTKIGVGYATNSKGVPYWTQMFVR